MFLCQLQPTYCTPESSKEDIDCEQAARQLPQALLLSCPNWIKHLKSQTVILLTGDSSPQLTFILSISNKQKHTILSPPITSEVIKTYYTC